MRAQLRELKVALQEELVTNEEYAEQRQRILTARKPPAVSASGSSEAPTVGDDESDAPSDPQTPVLPAKKKPRRTILDFGVTQTLVDKRTGLKRVIKVMVALGEISLTLCDRRWTHDCRWIQRRSHQTRRLS